MDKTRIKAILSGKPVVGLKMAATTPMLKPNAQMGECLSALNRLRAAPSTGHRRLELTTTQLPPCF